MQHSHPEPYDWKERHKGRTVLWLFWDERTYVLPSLYTEHTKYEPLPENITTVKEAKQFLSTLIRMGAVSMPT
jgi:hypothetical protein